MNISKTYALLLICLLGVCFYWYDDISYGVMQARGQLMVLSNARDVEDVLDDPEVSEHMKQKLRKVSEVKRFTEEVLNMEADGLYETMYDQEGKDILWNLSACRPFSMEEKMWTFPIVGEVSYKGFFDLEKAKAEANELKELGYDTRIRVVGAWSTLGWFDDPILSNTLSRDQGSFAELLMHEITHAHIFYKDSIRFNENLASFIGEQGAMLFLSDQHGEDSQELANYIAKLSDDRLFTNHCLNGLSDLKDLYAQFDDELNEAMKANAKSAYMRDWVGELRKMHFSDSLKYQDAFKNDLPNNAFFMAFARYDSKKSFFERELEDRFLGDLLKFIDSHRSE